VNANENADTQQQRGKNHVPASFDPLTQRGSQASMVHDGPDKPSLDSRSVHDARWRHRRVGASLFQGLHDIHRDEAVSTTRIERPERGCSCRPMRGKAQTPEAQWSRSVDRKIRRRSILNAATSEMTDWQKAMTA
jgi:hypothetical protein